MDDWLGQTKQVVVVIVYYGCLVMKCVVNRLADGFSCFCVCVVQITIDPPSLGSGFPEDGPRGLPLTRRGALHRREPSYWYSPRAGGICVV